MLKKILLVILIILLIGLVAFAVIIGGGGKSFQGALYNLRPIYRECRIEGQNYQSQQNDDCENFTNKFDEGAFPDGEYTIFTKYTNRQLPDNIIPIKISEKGQKLDCTFLENGYEPQISVFSATDPLSSQILKPTQELPISSDGTVAQINYRKNGQMYVYDTNICERAFQATLYDEDKKPMGTALMDHNGFINSRALPNELLFNNQPYFSSDAGTVEKNFSAGNIYATANFAPDIMFKLTIPCSSEKASVFIPTLETKKDIQIPFQGLNEHYLDTCSPRLYMSLQNTNRSDDIQIIDNLNLENSTKGPSYLLKLSQVARITDENTIFPISFKVSLHLRDRSDSNEVITLGSGLLTVTGYKATKEDADHDTPTPSWTSLPDIGIIHINIETKDNSIEAPKPKVRRTAA